MGHSVVLSDRPRVSTRTVLVALLHSPADANAALALARAWRPTVPAAAVSTLAVDDHGDIGDASGQLACLLEQAGLDATGLVLAGVGDAAETALQLAVGQHTARSLAMAGASVLACGDVLPPLALLAGRPGIQARLRLVWTADDPLFCATALGDLLRCCRIAGVDAQGAVLARAEDASGVVRSGFDPSPSLVRLGGAYLAELVAMALGAVTAKMVDRTDKGPEAISVGAVLV